MKLSCFLLLVDTYKYKYNNNNEEDLSTTKILHKIDML